MITDLSNIGVVLASKPPSSARFYRLTTVPTAQVKAQSAETAEAPIFLWQRRGPAEAAQEQRRCQANLTPRNWKAILEKVPF